MDESRDHELRDTPEPQRGSGEPAPGEQDPKTVAKGADRLDEERLAEGGAMPRVDALDVGEPGAPTAVPGTGATAGPGAGARHEVGAAGSGVRAGELRGEAHDLREGEDQPAGGGPGAGTPERRTEEEETGS